ncbi:MAG: hypothetical protein N3B13_09615, partial [Deltaproteobacteria bacterium]|nr:hypothetical protein [Deltaproteobacteria bacterium]
MCIRDRPQITEKSIKMISKEFSFLPHNNLLRYNNRFNIFFFISLNRTDSSGNNFYQLNYINFNNGNTDWTDIDYLPAEIYNINDLSFVLSKNSENDTFSLVNFNRDDKVITYTGLKYNGLSEF